MFSLERKVRGTFFFPFFKLEKSVEPIQGLFLDAGQGCAKVHY